MSSSTPGITIKKVDYQNSGDTKLGDKSQVVGYVALEFESSKKSEIDSGFHLTNQEKNTLLSIARNSIEQYVRYKTNPDIETTEITPALKTKCGVFVSLHISGELRGCIGTFRTDKALYKNVQEMADAAALPPLRALAAGASHPATPRRLPELGGTWPGP